MGEIGSKDPQQPPDPVIFPLYLTHSHILCVALWGGSGGSRRGGEAGGACAVGRVCRVPTAPFPEARLLGGPAWPAPEQRPRPCACGVRGLSLCQARQCVPRLGPPRMGGVQ